MSAVVTFPTDGRAGQTVVFQAFSQAGTVWRAASSAFVAYNSAQAASGDYDIATSEMGGSGVTGIFTGTFPSGPTANAAYRLLAYVPGSYTLPVSDAGWVWWDGTNVDLLGVDVRAVNGNGPVSVVTAVPSTDRQVTLQQHATFSD